MFLQDIKLNYSCAPSNLMTASTAAYNWHWFLVCKTATAVYSGRTLAHRWLAQYWTGSQQQSREPSPALIKSIHPSENSSLIFPTLSIFPFRQGLIFLPDLTVGTDLPALWLSGPEPHHRRGGPMPTLPRIDCTHN